MKYILQLGLILLIFCAVASGVLAFVNSKTRPVIAARKLLEEEQARKNLLPLAVAFEKHQAVADTTFVYYTAKDSSNQAIGYAFIAAKYGYSSLIKSMVALDKDYRIIDIKIIDQNETPGLGSICTEPEFTDLFKGFTLNELKVDKDADKNERSIKSITGATITTRAITSSIREGIRKLKNDLEQANTLGGGK